MKTTFRQRLFARFLLLFLLFAAGAILIERSQEKTFRTAGLEDRLDAYTGIIHRFILHNHLTPDSMQPITTLAALMPEQLRISIIDSEGNVLFDNEVDNTSQLENHLDRPEIRNARYSSRGSHIRTSASTRRKYLYHARLFDNRHYIRVALPYNPQTRSLLKPGNLFAGMMAALFAVALLLANSITRRFGKSVRQLAHFAAQVRKGQTIPETLHFRNDELGEIGTELIRLFRQIQDSKKTLETEREKLIRHIRFSGEGLCIFSPEMKKIYANAHFIRYVNLMTDHPTFDAEDILRQPPFQPLAHFVAAPTNDTRHAVFHISRNAKTFSLQAVVFDDRSFEIIIKDITQAQHTRRLKQEMTANIAHELRTPVCSLRAYLETLDSGTATPDRQKHFIRRAFLQTVRLSTLIDDVSLISKIEEAPAHFPVENIHLAPLVDEVHAELADRLAAARIHLTHSLPPGLAVTGNYTLLYAIFRNLVDNSAAHAGPDTQIHITRYAEDTTHLYFSYYDTGAGVSEEHLGRLFERFYRVTEGRTRNTGGSGLGLSIVRHAILFHQGHIQAKNRPGGGLEFLFTLRK
jgi:two-component system OmpR family sensor kinase/two-component system phosphate regulon sensor histidine kinase PhoR